MFFPTPKAAIADSSVKVDFRINPSLTACSKAFLSHIWRKGNVSCPEKCAGISPEFLCVFTMDRILACGLTVTGDTHQSLAFLRAVIIHSVMCRASFVAWPGGAMNYSGRWTSLDTARPTLAGRTFDGLANTR